MYYQSILERACYFMPATAYEVAPDVLKSCQVSLGLDKWCIWKGAKHSHQPSVQCYESAEREACKG